MTRIWEAIARFFTRPPRAFRVSQGRRTLYVFARDAREAFEKADARYGLLFDERVTVEAI